jgi:hypothetical protein
MSLVAYADENEDTSLSKNEQQSNPLESQAEEASFSIVAYEIDEEESLNRNSAVSTAQHSPPKSHNEANLSSSSAAARNTVSSSTSNSSVNTTLPSNSLEINITSLPPLNEAYSGVATIVSSQPHHNALRPSKTADFANWGPPPPSHPPSAPLLEKVLKFHEHKRAGKSINRNLRRSKEFKNPDILTKLVELVGISEIGTNYPPCHWNPFAYQPTDFFKELDKAQQAFVAQKLNPSEKQKRTHIDFVSSSKLSFAQPQLISSVPMLPVAAPQPPSTTASNEITASKIQNSLTTAEKKRKSKWDQSNVDTQFSEKTEESREPKRLKHS